VQCRALPACLRARSRVQSRLWCLRSNPARRLATNHLECQVHCRAGIRPRLRPRLRPALQACLQARSRVQSRLWCLRSNPARRLATNHLECQVQCRARIRPRLRPALPACLRARSRVRMTSSAIASTLTPTKYRRYGRTRTSPIK